METDGVGDVLVETTASPGTATGGGGTTRNSTVLHRVEDPLAGVASLCQESVLTEQREAWRRLVPYGSSRRVELDKATSCLELWVEW